MARQWDGLCRGLLRSCPWRLRAVDRDWMGATAATDLPRPAGGDGAGRDLPQPSATGEGYGNWTKSAVERRRRQENRRLPQLFATAPLRAVGRWRWIADIPQMGGAGVASECISLSSRI